MFEQTATEAQTEQNEHKLKARIKELELDLGLMTIARDHQAELCNSCERALHGRDERVMKLENALQDMRKYTPNGMLSREIAEALSSAD